MEELSNVIDSTVHFLRLSLLKPFVETKEVLSRGNTDTTDVYIRLWGISTIGVGPVLCKEDSMVLDPGQ